MPRRHSRVQKKYCFKLHFSIYICANICKTFICSGHTSIFSRWNL